MRISSRVHAGVRSATRSAATTFAASLLLPAMAQAQGEYVQTGLSGRTQYGDQFPACSGGQGSAVLQPSERLFQNDACNFRYELPVPGAPQLGYVAFTGDVAAFATATGRGVLATDAIASMTATPFGDVNGESIIEASAEARWRQSVFLTPLVSGGPIASSISFGLQCHGVFTNDFSLSSIGRVGVSGGCSATLDRYLSESFVTGTCESSARAPGADIIRSDICFNPLAEARGVPISFSVGRTLSAAEALGTSPLDLWLSSYSSAYASLYGGYRGTYNGILTVTSQADEEADLGSTMRLLGVQVLDANGQDITSSFTVMADNGYVIPALQAAVTTPEPGTLLLVLLPLAGVAVIRRLRPA